MADSRVCSKTEEEIMGDWTGQGPLEIVRKPSEPPARGSNRVPQCAAQVLCGPGNSDRRPQVQAALTAYGHEVGVPSRYLWIYRRPTTP